MRHILRCVPSCSDIDVKFDRACAGRRVSESSPVSFSDIALTRKNGDSSVAVGSIVNALSVRDDSAGYKSWPS